MFGATSSSTAFGIAAKTRHEAPSFSFGMPAAPPPAAAPAQSIGFSFGSSACAPPSAAPPAPSAPSSSKPSKYEAEGTDGNLYQLKDATQKKIFTCSTCSKVPLKMFYSNDSMLCETCSDKENNNPEEAPLLLQRELELLTMKCPNFKDGCTTESITRSTLKTHLKECSYQTVSCDNEDLGCEIHVKRHQLLQHVKSCQFSTNAEVMRKFKQLELKQKSLEELVESLQAKVKEQEETIKSLKEQVYVSVE
ncbi:hypothetical protein MP638_002162 [Amoeboaphelidium occidentale]|nr:hypothetical protein MP638_002162 [Amoeboaphelidium occidentale]